MIGFTMLGSNDIATARAFYDALMPLFGASLVAQWSTHARLWYASDATSLMLVITTPFDGKPASAGNGAMVALALPSQDAVNAAHARCLIPESGEAGLR